MFYNTDHNSCKLNHLINHVADSLYYIGIDVNNIRISAMYHASIVTFLKLIIVFYLICFL